MKRLSMYIVLGGIMLILLLTKGCKEKVEVPFVLSINNFEVSSSDFKQLAFSVSANANAILYLGAVEQGASALTPSTVKTTSIRAQISVTKGASVSIDLTQLQIGQTYDVYIMAEDTEGNQSTLQKIQASTRALPVFSFEKQNETSTSFDLNINSEIAANLVYVVQTTGEQAPTESSISGLAEAQSVTLQANTPKVISFTGLQPNSEYVVYYLLKTTSDINLRFESYGHTTQTAPPLTTSISASEATSFNLQVSYNSDVRVTYVLQLSNLEALTAETIVTNEQAETINLEADQAQNISFAGLSPSSNYTLYYLLEDSNGTDLLLETLNHMTPAIEVPTISLTRSNDTYSSFDLEITSDAAARITYLLQPASETAVDASSIVTATGAIVVNLAENVSQTLVFSNLAAETEYVFYYLVESPEGVDLTFQTQSYTTIAPVVAINFQVASSAPTAFDLQVTADQSVRFTYAIQQSETEALTAANINDAAGVQSVNLNANTQQTLSFDNLTHSTAYTVFYLVEDSDGTDLLFQSYEHTTVAYAIPTLSLQKSNEQPSSFDIAITANQNVSFKYLLQLSSEAAPTAETISGITATQTINLTSGEASNISFTDLTAETSYTLYYLVEASDGYDLVFSSLTHTTAAYVVPTLSFQKSNEQANSFDLSVTSTQNIGLKYVLQLSSLEAPTAATISSVSGVQSINLQANQASVLNFSNLNAATDYVLYYLAEASDGYDLLFNSLTHTTPAEPLSVVSSVPVNNATGVKVYDPISVTFDRNVEIASSGSIVLRSVNGVQNDRSINLSDIVVDGATITLDYNNYFRRTSNLYPINMHFGEPYILVINNAIQEQGGGAAFNGEAVRFNTQPHPNFFHTVRSDNEFSATLNWDNLSSYQQSQLTESKVLHRYSRAISESLTGDDVKVMIWDTGVAPSAEVYSAVVYQKLALDDPFITGDLTNYYSHGTQMCRYALNFAPGINIYDVYRSAYPESFNPVVFQKNDVQLAIDEDVDVLSLSGSGLEGDETLVTQFVNTGGVVSLSLGNNSGVNNDTTSYERKEKFIPYYNNIASGTGGLVCLQAIIPNGDGTFFSLRSKAGHTKHYTLCIMETGNGATSQAAATFSGIMALMLEANRVNNTNYTPRQLVEILFETAVDIGETGVDNIFGHGYINIDAAITKLKTGTAPSFTLYGTLDANVREFFERN